MNAQEESEMFHKINGTAAPIILKQSELEEFKAALHNFIGRLHEHLEAQEEGSKPYWWTVDVLADASALMENF